jgi:hypothetical protein
MERVLRRLVNANYATVVSPLEFMQRLAARFLFQDSIIRFHGVLTPNAKHRSGIIPSAPVSATKITISVLKGQKLGLRQRW